MKPCKWCGGTNHPDGPCEPVEKTAEVPAPDEREVWLIEDKCGNPIKFATEMSYNLMFAMGWSVVRYVRAREGGR